MFRPRATTYYRSLHITIYTFSDEYYYEPCVQNNYNFAAAAAPRNMADRWRNISVQKPQLLSCFNSVLPKSIHLELDLPFFLQIRHIFGTFSILKEGLVVTKLIKTFA